MLLPVEVATDEAIDVSALDVRDCDVAAPAPLDRVVVEAIMGFASELTRLEGGKKDEGVSSPLLLLAAGMATGPLLVAMTVEEVGDVTDPVNVSVDKSGVVADVCESSVPAAGVAPVLTVTVEDGKMLITGMVDGSLEPALVNDEEMAVEKVVSR